MPCHLWLLGRTAEWQEVKGPSTFGPNCLKVLSEVLHACLVFWPVLLSPLFTIQAIVTSTAACTAWWLIPAGVQICIGIAGLLTACAVQTNAGHADHIGVMQAAM